MAGRLVDKVAVITGAGRGIGAAIATAFAREGARVVVAERDAEAGTSVAAATGGLFIQTDVTSSADVDRTVRATLDAFGRVDILVNNAGANVFYRPHEMPRHEWMRCMSLDLEACWAMAEAVLPNMRQNRSGAIVNIASIHSFKIIPHTFPYPVAKHGLLGLTRALAVEYAGEGVRCNAIAPGYIDTDLARQYWATFADPAAERSRIEALHPPRRIGSMDEVAMTAVFLASNEAPFINGECIVIDGGRSLIYHE